MVFEWVPDYDLFPSKKKKGSCGFQMQGSTLAKRSATVEVPTYASIEDLEPNYSYLAHYNMEGYLGGSNPIAGWLRHDDNKMEQSDGGESIADKSAGASVGVENENNGVDFDDPQYKLFLQNIRGEENGYVVHVEAYTGLKESMVYEPELRKTKKRVKLPTELENDAMVEILDLGDDGKINNSSRKRNRRENDMAKCTKNTLREGKRVASSSRMGKGSSKRLCQVVPWDDSYLAFMLCYRGDEDRYIYTNLNGKQVKYHEEVEVAAESDLEILSPNDISDFETNLGFVVSKPSIVIDADVDCLEDMTPPDLREKMIAELKRPYDATEYANLLKEVKLRKPQEKCRQLRRRRDVDYQTDATCKSYLEMHPGLGRKMKLARGNHPAVLNLLRGFFFWLKYVPYNMFQPWTDPQCLNILPQTTEDDAPSLPPLDASTAIVPYERQQRQK